MALTTASTASSLVPTGNTTIEDFVKSLKSNDLAKFLSQIVNNDDYEDDIKKLKENRINGKIFLTLPDNPRLLDRLKLSIGGEEEFRSIIEKIKDGSFELPQAGGQKLLEPDMPWCSTETPVDNTTPVANAITDDGMQGAWIPADAVWPWKECKEILVEFWNAKLLSKWTINNGQTMNTVTVLHYANTWSRMGDGKIPRFVEAENGKQAHLRVSFNNKQIRNSKLGMGAQQVPLSEPTMNLDLHNGCPGDQYKKHLIIHEFGHALGLGHEHQRSNFWTSIRPFVNVEKMKKDLCVSDDIFERDWGEIVSSESGSHTQYDPDSIMHYWFKTDWLNPHYRSKENIERDIKNKKLTAAQAEALLGVHRRHGKVANEPSSLDLKLLKEIYGGSAKSTGAPPSASLSPEVFTVEGGKRVMTDTDLTQQNATTNRLTIEDLLAVKNELWPVRIQWRSIGESLKIHPTSLDSMAITEREKPDACLREVVATWLRMSSTPEHPITWYALVSALQQDNNLKQECGAVTQEISRKYLH